MVKVVFEFNKEKDLWNHWDKSNWNPSYGNFNVNPITLEICKGKEFEECKDELAESFKRIYESKLIVVQSKAVEKAWRGIEEKFFKRMDKLMKDKFSKDITAYLTTSPVCPYDTKEPSFMYSLFSSLPGALGTCGHEIMHLYFHEFYWNGVEKKIGGKKTGDLKEALTVLLNTEFKDLWFSEDRGYEEHKELREFITLEWENKKDFKNLLEKCVEYLR